MNPGGARAGSWAGRAAALAPLLSLVAACATAVPAMVSGSTTPHLRTDVAAGGAIRITRGEARASATTDPALDSQREGLNASGVVPVAMARYGLRENLDLGVLAAGTALRVDVRGERVLRQGSTRVALVYGGGLGYGHQRPREGEDGAANLVIVEPVVSLGVDFGGLYDVYAAPRFVLTSITGAFEDDAGALRDVHGLRLQVGGTFGIAAGLRRVHVFVEISALHERHVTFAGSSELSGGGRVLLPAFGLRVRI